MKIISVPAIAPIVIGMMGIIWFHAMLNCQKLDTQKQIIALANSSHQFGEAMRLSKRRMTVPIEIRNVAYGTAHKVHGRVI
jgi:hypothetical protein